METIAVTPEQGKQMVQHLDELIFELSMCLLRWRHAQRPKWKQYLIDLLQERQNRRWKNGPQWASRMEPRRSLIDLLLAFLKRPRKEEKLIWEKFNEEIGQLRKLSRQVEKQVEQGHVEKPLLIKLNEKLGKIQANYGNILVFSATIAAIISGLKDLIELLLGK